MLTGFILLWGAVSGWIATAAIDSMSYYGVFGGLKRRIILPRLNDEEHALLRDIVSDRDMDAREISEAVNDQVYWHAAKRSKLIYWLMCPYCMGVWIFTAGSLFATYSEHGIVFNITYYITWWLAGIGTLYFFLNFAKK